MVDDASEIGPETIDNFLSGGEERSIVGDGTHRPRIAAGSAGSGGQAASCFLLCHAFGSHGRESSAVLLDPRMAGCTLRVYLGFPISVANGGFLWTHIEAQGVRCCWRPAWPTWL